jgi:putative transposase
MSVWFAASELAALELPGLPATRQKVSDFIRRASSAAPTLVRPRAGRGGGYEIHVDALPEAARAELQRRHHAKIERHALKPAPAATPPARRQTRQVAPQSLTHRQRAIMTARLIVLQEIDRIALIGGRGRTAAISEFLADFRAGVLPAEIEQAARAANAKGRGVSRAQIFEWFGARKAGATALAPRPTREPEAAPAWLDGFLTFYAQPQKPQMAEAYRDWAATLPAGSAPSYAAVRRALGKLSHIEQAKGREGKLTMRARQAYVIRDFADLAPSTIYAADGTTFDAEVEHPIHGRPFKPEITVIVDIATRRAVGWSAGLAESQWTVADALRRACETAIPAIFYTDRGSGYVNAAMNADLTGLLARLGTTHMRALPYNSQAKGAVENFQKRWIAVARSFPTYGGAGMDKEAKQAAYKQTRRDIAFVGKSHLLPTWTDFVATIEAAIVAHNDKPHRALPWFRDQLTGSKRHMSPNELWAEKVAAGAELVTPDADELTDLFRPYEVRRVRRCMVEIGSNSYFATALDALHGQDVMVGYDVKDASRVWIRRIDLVDGERRPGALICEARFEGNKTRYIPVSMERAALEKRAEGRRRRLADKLDRVEAELRPAALIELNPVPTSEFAAASAPARCEQAGGLSAGVLVTPPPAVESPPADTPERGRPFFRNDFEFALWISAHPAEATANDRELVVELLTSDASKNWLRLQGLDLDRLRSVVVANAA